MIELKSATGKTYLTIQLDQKNKWLYNNWTGYVSTDNVRQGAISFLELLEESDCSYSLTDNRELVGPWEKSLTWIRTDWIPAAKKPGYDIMPTS
ncbi:hypothetical protein GCM10028895_21490 [Pontibacter rugosus]